MPWIARRSVQFEALNSPLRSDLNNIILLSVLGCTKVDHFQSRKIVDYIRGRRKTSADLRRRPSSPLVICTLRRGSSGRRNPWLVYHRGIHHIYHLTGPQLILHRLRLLIAIHARGFALPFFAGLTAGFAAYHYVAGFAGVIIVAGVASGATLTIGQIAFPKVQSTLIRGAIGLIYAVPAGVTAYNCTRFRAVGYSVRGLAHDLRIDRGGRCRRHGLRMDGDRGPIG
jgi:hypothetical protein